MITLVEALNYRCLQYVQRRLEPFHVLVGPNASGKTTFMDVIGFLRDLVSGGLDAALLERTPTPGELLFRGQGDRFELAVEARIPRELRRLTMRPELDTARYQVAIGFDETQRQFEFKAETLMLKKTAVFSAPQKDMFPMPSSGPTSIVLSPELETRVWSDSSHVEEVTGWKGRRPRLRHWLVDQGWLRENEVEPEHPKEAFQAALREARRPRSASLYRQIAERVSLRRCTDGSFLELEDVLRDWFPGD